MIQYPTMSRRYTLLLLGLATSVHAQLHPVRLYNGIHRSVDIEVRTPLTSDLASIQIFDGSSKKLEEEAPVQPGPIDLQQVFPKLWANKSAVRYAQLVVGGKKLGPPLVLLRITNPELSKLDKDGKSIKFVPDDSPLSSGLRIWTDKDVLIQTSAGPIRLHMRPDAAPNTVLNFLSLVEGGFYRDIIWHRVVAKRKDGSPFVIQAGDQTGSGDGGPGYNIALENSKLPHAFGVISMARSSDPNTNGSQIFICLSRKGTRHLDHKYSSFGEAVAGKETILKIAATPVGKDGRPLKPPVVVSATLIDANAIGEEPNALSKSSPG